LVKEDGFISMYGIASTTADVASALVSTGSLLALVAGSVLVGLISLMGVGYSKNKIASLLSDNDRIASGLSNFYGEGRRIAKRYNNSDSGYDK